VDRGRTPATFVRKLLPPGRCRRGGQRRERSPTTARLRDFLMPGFVCERPIRQASNPEKRLFELHARRRNSRP
jgi:hypothetical protein